MSASAIQRGRSAASIITTAATVLFVVAPAAVAPAAVAPAVAVSASGPVLDPHGPTEPAHTEIRQVDGTNVVLQYGETVPSFDGWRVHEPTRDYLSLDGAWRFRFDPDNVGLDQAWQRPDLRDADWDGINVPSSWDLKDTPGFGGYDGRHFGIGTAFTDGYAWYRTTVRVPDSWHNRHVRLASLGAGYSADVWVNGVHLGKHEGAGTPFAMPLDDALQPGQDTVIAVRVYRRASYTSYTSTGSPVTDDKAIPYKPVDYWPYAGLTRSLWLEATAKVTVAKVLINAADGRLEAKAVIENHSRRRFAGTVVVDPGVGSARQRVAVDVPAGGLRVAAASIPIPDAPTWSPAEPALLTATASLEDGKEGMDQLRATYGMRSVAVSGSRLLVNGAQVFLKGVNWHEESAAGGRSMTTEDYDAQLGHVLDLGANLIRNSVYNRHPYAYDWADTHGVFVYDDIDTMWLNTAQEKLQTQQYGLSRALAAAMAWNQHNHPSVLLWGLQNESEIDAGGGATYRAWLADMKQAVTAVDLQRRPVTWASHTTYDPAFDLADVIGVNEYFGYFYGRDADLGPALDGVHQRHPNKPLLITENGTWSMPGQHGPATQQGTEEWQAAEFRAHWDQVTARSDYLAGYTYWLLKDYKERAGYNQDLNGISVMGMLDFDATTPRLVYGAFRDAALPRILYP